MIKESVKKPFTVLVAVIMVLVLGFVSVTSLTMDLLPSMSLPYMIVISTYPGASAEKVQAEVTVPLENALGTVNGVMNVYSTSAENYATVQLEFEDGTDMDSAMVKVSSAVQQVAASLPDMAGTPSILELSADMMATMYVAVSRDGYDIYELSDYVDREVVPYVSRQSGVASVSTIGLVEKSVQVELNAGRIDDLNDKLLVKVNDSLAEAKAELTKAENQVADGKKELEKQQASFGTTMSGQLVGAVEGSVLEMAEDLRGVIADILPEVKKLQEQHVGATVDDQLWNILVGLEQADSLLVKVHSLTDLLGGALDLESLLKELEGVLGELSKEENRVVVMQAMAEIYNILGGMQDTNGDGKLDADELASQLGSVSPETLENLVAAVELLTDILENSNLGDEMSLRITKLKAAVNVLNSLSGNGGEMPGGESGGVDILTLRSTLNDLHTLVAEIYSSNVGGAVDDAIDGVYDALVDVMDLLAEAPNLMDSLEEMMAMLFQGQLDAAVGFSSALMQLTAAEQQLTEAKTQFESAREQALKSANLDALLNIETLSQLIYAHNFSMPAGYIDDADDHSWLLKVGDEFDSAEILANTLLCSVDGIGDVRLCDVADVTVIDNADDSYAKVNGQDAVVLSIFKSSTAGTNAVSATCIEAFETLETEDTGTRMDILMDQGDYIDIIVGSIFSSMALGSILAIFVLAMFLKDVKPTLVVAVSIPLSVLFAIVLMYFTGLSLNMITLSGLALGIGMLVDNSVVVLENIYRLRGRGVEAPRASVQGTRQVAGSIIASTLTTVCVFLPMLFATGTVRELLIPMGLSISYCLMASLIVAMTVVPATCSTLLRRSAPKEHPWFDRALEVYGKALDWCLDRKALSLLVAVALLVLCIWQVLRTGLVLLPDMTAEQITVTVTTGEEMDRMTSYETMDEVMDRINALPGVDTVGVMDSGSQMSMMAGALGGGGGYGSYTCYVMPESDMGNAAVKALCEEINAVSDGLDCTVSATSNGMGDLGALMSGGLSVAIHGNDMDTLIAVSKDVMAIVDEVEGFENIRNGLEDVEASRHLVIDRDAAGRAGLTTAQIYMEIAARLTNSATATTITVDGGQLNVTVTDNTDPLKLEELVELEITATSMDETGKSVEKTCRLGEFAKVVETPGVGSINRENQSMYISVSADTAEGKNTTLLSRELDVKLEAYKNSDKLPKGVTVLLEGESSTTTDMVVQMGKMMALALIFIYLVMVAQFQSLLSPFIVLFTVPLAFTGGMLGLMAFGEQMSLLALMGFLVLMGTVVNNGIVFVDYTNQLRMGGMSRRDALIATGKTRMRPILMTTLTTILAMTQMIFGDDMGSQLGRGMAIVICGGLLYATAMTLFVVPVMYDILFKRPPMNVDLGSENLDDVPDDAAEFLAEKAAREAAANA